jgi:radical SAM protein with 4Fe4S-binding SPASM domain
MPPPTPGKAPLSVLWEITLRCNLQCCHCASSAGRARSRELSTAEALGIVDQLVELGTPAVGLMGGEPLLRRDWPEIASALRRGGVQVGLVTNGWFFDEAVADQVRSLGLAQVVVSLDAADPRLHDELRGRAGSHARVLAALRRLADLPLANRTVVTSVQERNLPELENLHRLLEDTAPGISWTVNIASCHDAARFGASSTLDESGVLALADFVQRVRSTPGGTVELTGAHDLGFFGERWPNLRAEPWAGCDAGLRTLGIRSNGDVVGCLVQDDSFVEGNALETPLSSLWSSPDRFAYNRHFHPELLEGECRGCEMGARCRGGCRDIASSAAGSRFEFPFCLRVLERRATEKEKAR